MKPEIINIEEIKLIGMHINHSLSNNKTIELWQKFMPLKKEIPQIKTPWHYAVQQYDNEIKMEKFNPETRFDIWAAVEVIDLENIPKEMNSLIIPEGKYAIFIHKGDSQMFVKSMAYIMNSWLPNSIFKIGNRPHFQIMKEKYLDENNPNSEEEIWIPIDKRD